jgi:peptidoglycan hydrolase-like protein with peptidoglycan-binding domain
MTDLDPLPIDEPTEPDADESQSDVVVPPDFVPVTHSHARPGDFVHEDSEVLPLTPVTSILPEQVQRLVESAQITKPPAVPRPRVVHQGTSGLDVVAIKRALSRVGFIPWGAFTPLFGPAAVAALKQFQTKHGIKPTGAYGTGSHIALAHSPAADHPGEWAFDDYAILLMREEVALLAGTPELRIRKGIVAAAYFYYAHRNQIPYVQARPGPLSRPPYVPTNGIDCSWFYTMCCFDGGAPNPNGRPWDGQGYTGTLMSRGRKCTLAELKMGDAIFYGFTTNPSAAFPYGSPTHVALYLGDGTVISNGHSPMGHYPVNYGMPVNHYRTYDVAA